MKRVILTRGLPASGKSTWAKEQLATYPGQYKRISKDDLRSLLDDGRWSKHNEKFVLAARDALILQALADGFTPIVDDTNLAPKHAEHIAQLVKDQARVEVQDFTHVPLEECIKRDQRRPNYTGEKVIRQMHNQFLRPAVPALKIDPELPCAVICDLDGTLALFGGANPYDRNFMADQINHPVRFVLRSVAQQGVRIILASGRKDMFRDQTVCWLGLHEVPYDHLHMRADGDMRKDAIVKREMYDAHIAGRYTVLFVLDDRNSVVDLWRSLGLTCMQVADGDF